MLFGLSTRRISRSLHSLHQAAYSGCPHTLQQTPVSREAHTLVPLQFRVQKDEGRDAKCKLKGWRGPVRGKQEGSPRFYKDRQPYWSNRNTQLYSNNNRKIPSAVPSIAGNTSEPALKADLHDTEKKDGEHTGEAGEEIKVIKKDSKTFAEVYSILISRNITASFLQQLQGKVNFLHMESVPASKVKILLKKRAFLSATPERLVAVVELLAEFFGSKSIAFDVLVANAGILARPLDILRVRLHLLTEFEVDREACIKLGRSVGMWTVELRRLGESLSFLKGLGMNAHDLSYLIHRRPIVLRHTEAFMRSTVDFFENIGVCHTKLLHLLRTCPVLLASSVDNNLLVKFKLFQDWGLSVDEFTRVLPDLCHTGAETIASRYELLRERGLPHEIVTRLLKMQPWVFALSTEDVKAKLDYLFHTLNRDVSELERFPYYFGYSLKGRIVPRFKALEEVGLPYSPPLCGVLTVSASVFRKRFKIPQSVKCNNTD